MASEDSSAAERPVSLRITRGTASEREIAALVVAFGALAGEADVPAAPSTAAWTAAARLEGIGARLVSSRADLAAP